MYIREVNLSKWKQSPDTFFKSERSLPADLITSSRELRTSLNSLSFWKVDSLDQLLHVACALQNLGDRRRPDKKTLVVLKEDDLPSALCFKLASSPEEAVTFFTEMRSRHYNLINLNYSTLGMVSRCILGALDGKDYYTVTPRKITVELKKLYVDNHLERIEDMSDGIKKLLRE